MSTGDWPFGALSRQAYGFIMADPPWSFRTRSEKGLGKSAQRHYRCLSTAEIAQLPVQSLSASHCVLWLWATSPMLPVALHIMDAWGFIYKTGGAWVKKTRKGATAFGTGYVLRSSCEPFLIGTRGSPRTTRAVSNVVEGIRREHSRKPDEAYAAAERLMPQVRRADLFSREFRPGWECWGDETGKFGGVDAPC